MDNIVPSILEGNIKEVERKLSVLKDGFERVHIDIVDGLFADNLTITPKDVAEFDKGRLKVDYHLMVDDPMAWVEECIDSGSSRIIAQVERMGSQEAFVDWVKGYDGVEVGLAIDLFTPIGEIESDVLQNLDSILLLGVKAGFGGQEFHKGVVDKINGLLEVFDGSIIIDGGVDPEVYKLVMEEGASEVAVNSYLWNTGNIKKKMEDFKI